MSQYSHYPLHKHIYARLLRTAIAAAPDENIQWEDTSEETWRGHVNKWEAKHGEYVLKVSNTEEGEPWEWVVYTWQKSPYKPYGKREEDGGERHPMGITIGDGSSLNMEQAMMDAESAFWDWEHGRSKEEKSLVMNSAVKNAPHVERDLLHSVEPPVTEEYKTNWAFGQVLRRRIVSIMRTALEAGRSMDEAIEEARADILSTGTIPAENLDYDTLHSIYLYYKAEGAENVWSGPKREDYRKFTPEQFSEYFSGVAPAPLAELAYDTAITIPEEQRQRDADIPPR